MLRQFTRHRLVQDALILFGVQVCGYILPLITLPYLTRVLGPGNFGLLAIGQALAMYFLMFSEYGFAVTGTRRVAISQGDRRQAAREYSTIMGCKLLLIVAGFLVMVGLLVAIPALGTEWRLYVLSFLIVAGWGLSPNWYFQGMQRMKYVAYSDYGAKILSVVLIFILVRRTENYLIAATLQSGAFLMSALIGLGFLFVGMRVRPVRPEWVDMRKAMIEGWPVFLSMAGMTIMSSSNTMVLGMTASTAQVGFLNAATRLIVAARALTNPVTSAVYPHMSRLAVISREEGVRFFERRLLWTAAPFLAVTAGMLVMSSWVVRALYGPEYAETAVLLRIMSPIPIVHAVSMCFGTYYMLAFGYEKEWSRIIRRMVTLNFVCLLPLIAIMPPARAVATTMTLMDVVTAGSCILFYVRTESQSRRSGHARK